MKWSIILVIFLTGCYRESATLESTNINNQTESKGEELTTKNEGYQPHTKTYSSFQPRKFSNGEILYINYCADCHGWEGRGNGQAEEFLDIRPPILLQHDVLAEKNENDFVKWVLTGSKMQVQLNKMTTPHTDPEIQEILSYIKQLPSLNWDKIEAGQEVYDQLCVNCHGIYGHGNGSLTFRISALLPDLSDSNFQLQHSDEELFQIISKGKEAMPSTEEVLNNKEIESVVAYIRLFSPGYESYDRFCSTCHGFKGSPEQIVILDNEYEALDAELQNINLPTFDSTYLNAHTDKQLVPKIQHMLNTNRITMSHFSDYLEENKVRDIFRYLKGLIAEYP